MTDSNRKKIVIIGPAYPYRGGNSLYVSSVYSKLRDIFNVTVINFKLLYPSFLFPGTTQNDVSGKLIYQIPSERIINSINPFTWIKTAKRIKTINPDLIIFDWWNPFFGPALYTISRLIKKKFKSRIVFITENVISHEGRFIDKLLTKIGLKNADSFMVLSEKVKKEIVWSAKNRPVYLSALPIYDCYKLKENIKPEAFRKQLGYSENDIILLFFGYVRKYKGLNILIESLPDIIKKNSRIRLLIVGEFYDNPSTYIEKINALSLTNHVKIINKFVPNEEVGEYYLAADLNILPYRSATQSGILNVSYGFLKPVLVTNVGGLSEFVNNGKTGIVVEPNSPEAIVKGVKDFFKLANNVDFPGNIRDFIKGNKFEKLPELFEEIIEDSDK